jgi:hypothetical protein
VLGIIAVFMALAQNGSAGFWFAAVASAISGVLLFTYKRAVKAGLEGIFYLVLFPLTISAFFPAVGLVSPLATWEYSGPALLFLGVLTLIIASFDWASLGLTWALLRRGLELGGWWPYALAVLDACLAAVIIVALALTMVVGVQAFDTLAVQGGGPPILPLSELFDGIAAHPSAPEYWWLYALLLSTMIPSLVNLRTVAIQARLKFGTVPRAGMDPTERRRVGGTFATGLSRGWKPADQRARTHRYRLTPKSCPARAGRLKAATPWAMPSSHGPSRRWRGLGDRRAGAPCRGRHWLPSPRRGRSWRKTRGRPAGPSAGVTRRYSACPRHLIETTARPFLPPH